jgi:hypothetical protein
MTKKLTNKFFFFNWRNFPTNPTMRTNIMIKIARILLTYHQCLSHNSSRWNLVHNCIDNHLPDRCKWRRACKVSFRIHLYLVLGFFIIDSFFVLKRNVWCWDDETGEEMKEWREKNVDKKIKYLCYIRRHFLWYLPCSHCWPVKPEAHVHT